MRELPIQSEGNVVLLAEQKEPEEELHMAAVCGHVESLSDTLSEAEVQHLLWQDSKLKIT